MNKKILIVSMLVLILLLLMPSITAIQQKTIDYKLYNDFIEKKYDFNLNHIGKLDGIEYEALFNLTVMRINFSMARASIIWDLATEGDGYDFIVIYPLLSTRALLIIEKTFLMAFFWDYMSYLFGWDWDYLVDIVIEMLPWWCR